MTARWRPSPDLKCSEHTGGSEPNTPTPPTTSSAYSAPHGTAPAASTQNCPSSPTQNVDWFPEERRDRAIPLASLPQWYREVMALTNTVRRDYYLLGVFTGLRRDTIGKVRLADLDLENATLQHPPSRRAAPSTPSPTLSEIGFLGPDPRPDEPERQGRPEEEGGAQPFRIASFPRSVSPAM